MNLSKLNLLREIEQKYDMWVDDYNLTPQDTEWLIEQAERAQKNAQDLEDMDRQLYSEQQQNKRYRERIKYMLQEARDHKQKGLSIQHWALIKDLEITLKGE